MLGLEFGSGHFDLLRFEPLMRENQTACFVEIGTGDGDVNRCANLGSDRMNRAQVRRGELGKARKDCPDDQQEPLDDGHGSLVVKEEFLGVEERPDDVLERAAIHLFGRGFRLRFFAETAFALKKLFCGGEFFRAGRTGKCTMIEFDDTVVI